MKLALVCGFAWEPKGTVRARAFPLAAELARRGHEVRIFTVPYDNPKYSGCEYTRSEVRIVNLKVSKGSISKLSLAPFRLVRQVCDWGPDVVHVFKPKGFAGAACELLLRKESVRVVLDCDDWEGWGGWNEVSHHSWIVKQWVDWQERTLVSRVPVLTVASHVLADRAHSLGKNHEQVFHVPNCASRELLDVGQELRRKDPNSWKRELGLPSQPAILYVGHFDPLDDLLFFCNGVASAASKARATVVIVGDGPELSKVKKFFSERTEVQTCFTGTLGFEDYLRMVAACDIATFPYPDNPVYRAKCSARIVDFMALSKPIITSSVGENPYYLIDGESGILVSPNDRSAYEGALELLLANEELRQTIGQQARQRAASLFVWDKQVENCLEAYRKALNSKTGAQRIAAKA